MSILEPVVQFEIHLDKPPWLDERGTSSFTRHGASATEDAVRFTLNGDGHPDESSSKSPRYPVIALLGMYASGMSSTSTSTDTYCA